MTTLTQTLRKPDTVLSPKLMVKTKLLKDLSVQMSNHLVSFIFSCQVTTDKKSLAYVDNMLKKSNKKVEELHQELQELNAHIVVKDPEELLGKNTDNLLKVFFLVVQGKKKSKILIHFTYSLPSSTLLVFSSTVKHTVVSTLLCQNTTLVHTHTQTHTEALEVTHPPVADIVAYHIPATVTTSCGLFPCEAVESLLLFAFQRQSNQQRVNRGSCLIGFLFCVCVCVWLRSGRKRMLFVCL